MRQPRGPKKSGWRSTEAGARARGVARMAACKAQRVQVAGVEGCAPEAAGEPLLEGPPPSGERQVKEAGRGDQTEHTGVHRRLRPHSGCHTPRSNGECCRSPRERYHLPRKGHPPTPRPRLAGAAGTGVGRAGAGKARAGQSGPSSRADNPLPTQGDYMDHCSW